MKDAYLLQFEDFLRQHFSERSATVPLSAQKLIESVQYSLFSGGKRFRPTLTSLVANTLRCGHERIFAFAAAIEMIHTYSLIHDDLPCMDDDDIRRGQPTNHVRYDEATALLAGDALLTEAFYVIGKYYEATPDIGLKLTHLLSEAAGLSGMVAGQVIDISLLQAVQACSSGQGITTGHRLITEQGLAAEQLLTTQQLLNMHELKTGALIRVAAEGAAVIARASKAQTVAMRNFGALLGLAFQLADDILDYDPKNLEASGFPKLIGIEETQKLLTQSTQQALHKIEKFGLEAQGLRDLVEFNFSRKV